MTNYGYKCRICKNEWESDIGAIQFCKCGRLVTADRQPINNHDIPKVSYADNKNFEKKYKNDPMGWKRAGYVSKSADWNPKTRQYESGGSAYRALTSKGRSRPLRSDFKN
jgi:hypothetical protein